MAKKQLTETESLAKCLARALRDEPDSFGAEQAKVACDELTRQFQAGEVDAGTFGRVNARIGNHSAIRQWATMNGFIKRDADALAHAVGEEIAKLADALEKMAQGQ